MMPEESSTAEVGEQRGHLRRGDAHDDEGEEADQRGGDRDHRHQPRRAQTFQESQQDSATNQPPRFGPTEPTGQLLPMGWFRYG